MTEGKGTKLEHTEQDSNIGFEFFRTADANPDFPAVIAEDITLTYAQLKRVVEAFAWKMKQAGVDQTSMIIVETSDLVASVSTLLASALLGAQYAYAGNFLARAKVVKATHFFATTEASDLGGVDVASIDQSWSPHNVFKNNDALDTFEGYSSPDAPWLITHTSGTTGFPKFISLSQRTVFDRSIAARADYIPHKTCFAPLFNCTARPFVSRALSALLSPCTIVDSRDASFFLKNGVNLVVGSPEQVKDILAPQRFGGKIPMLHCGGGKLETSSIRQMLENFDEVVDLYGSSETNRTFKNVHSLDNQGCVVSRGELLDSELQIVDEHDELCDVDEPGVVRVRNGYLANGYLNNPEAQQRCFRGGWFYPGDLARWGHNGELKIEGRTDDVVNLGGTKVNARITENTLRLAEGVKDAICFRNPKDNVVSELVAFVVLEPLTLVSDCLDRARNTCIRNLKPKSVPARVFRVDEIPVGPDGRPDRKKCETLVLAKFSEQQV
jgi:acyl-CoA synthetase (AMP-forming)/AMP-acid ligase II